MKIFDPKGSTLDGNQQGLANFHDRYRKAVDLWVLFDNYGIKPKLIDWSDK